MELIPFLIIFFLNLSKIKTHYVKGKLSKDNSITVKEQNSTIIIKDNELKKLKSSYKEIENFFENATKEKEIISSEAKEKINELNNLNDNLKKENIKLENTIKELNEKNNYNNQNINIDELQSKITQIEIENKKLKDKNQEMKKYSEEIVKRIKIESKDSEYLIDKRMISSILFKYFDPYTNNSIKNSLLETLANFMNYNNDERYQLGLSSKSNDILVGSKNNNKDKLKKIGDELYDFITNS